MAGKRDLPYLASNLTSVIPTSCAEECGKQGFEYSGTQVSCHYRFKIRKKGIPY